ncbi:unnamed protein product [Brassica rapa subsp. narinosa]
MVADEAIESVFFFFLSLIKMQSIIYLIHSYLNHFICTIY